MFKNFYYIHFEITGYLCNLIGSQQCDLFPNRTICALNRIFFSANENETVKQKQPIRFQGFFKPTNHIAGK